MSGVPARRVVAVTLGDPAGVGPEIALKAAADPRVRERCRIVLFGDRRALDMHAQLCGMSIDCRTLSSASEIAGCSDELAIVHVDSLGEGLELGRVAARYGAATVAALDAAVQAAMDGHVDAVVGAPIHEVAIKEAGIAFDGHPSYLARRTNTPIDEVVLMLCWDSMRIAHVTVHLSTRDAIEMITRERVEKVIRATARALRQLGYVRPRIGVSGVNPHAGESGLFGTDEIERIAPAIEACRGEDIELIGPISADTLLPRSDCDAFVVMLHDQGHVPAKLMAKHGAAALSIGTPVLFSSVGHGTAMDIAGQNKASPEAMVQALMQVTHMHSRGANQ